MARLTQCIILGLVLSVTGCQNHGLRDNADLDDNQREYILDKVNNYRGLIKLYRDKLNRKEDAGTRYQLAEYYYIMQDYESSLHYLAPLLASKPNEAALLLQSKNLQEQGKVSEALAAVTAALRYNPENGEAYNIQGILLAENGDFNGARQAFTEARLRFVEDDIVINNLAMLAIMQEDYLGAREYLIPLYSRGNPSQKLLYNLVFVLVKLKDYQSAEEIMRQERLSGSPEEVLESLAKVKPRTQLELQQKAAVKLNAEQPGTLAKSDTPLVTPPPSLLASEKPTVQPLQPTNTNASLQAAAQQKPVATPVTEARLPPPVVVTPAERLLNKPALVPAPAIGLLANTALETSQTETASLVASGNLKEVSAIRAGQHQKYFRMTLESLGAINFKEVNSAERNKRVFELQNVKLGQNMLTAGEKISRDHRNIRKLTFHQKDMDTVLVEFEFKQPVTKTNVFRLSADKTSQERLVFDVYHG